MADNSDPPGTGRTHYLDFELEIGSGSEGTYAVSVIRSPAGEARETMRFPFDQPALERHLKDLQIALLRSGGARRQLLAPEEQAVQTFGRELFDALISGETRSRYDLSSREARQQGMGLRLKLRIKPPELAALPWEFLYDPRQAEYICLSRDTPVIRYLELPHPIQPLVVRPPLSILGMIASPRDQSQLDIGREKRRTERAVQTLQSQGLVNLTWLEGQTWRDLQRAMRGGPWHIFHFIGHGGFDHTTDEGLIALADSEGMTRSFRATELGRLLADHRSLRLVLLNSCEGARASERDIFSSTASILVRRGLPAVLAMQYEITDPAAIEFARAFYEALADGLPVDAAVTEARKAVSLAVTNSVEWGIPVVYMRAPQGIIFQLPETGRVRRRPPGPPTFLDKEQEARLDQLYTEGLSAFWVEDWDRACRVFQAILDEYPGYPNAAAKLEEARLQRKLNTLYAEARAAEEAGDWAAALSALERLVSEAPDFKDAAARLERARGQKQLADLYEEVRRLYQAEQWQAVVNVFAQIQALDPGYGDPDGLLAESRRHVAAQKRQAELDQLYRQAIVELDAGHWSEAQRLLASLEAQEPGFRETKRLLERAEAELAREEAAQRREEQLASLYEQALGLARAGQWRGALAKLEEVHELDPQFPDPEGIAAQAQEGIAREEAEAQRQSELAALYAEAVRLLQAEQYQAALEKWGEVQARDPRYPDRQKVGATARKRLNDLAKAGSPRRQPPRWAIAALGLLGVAVLVAIGALLIRGGGTTTPEPGASQLPGVAVKATGTPTPTSTSRPTAAQAEAVATDQPEVASVATAQVVDPTAQAAATVTARYAPIATVLAEGTATAQVVDATAQAAATAARQDILTSLANTPLSNPEVLYHDDFDRLSSSEWDYDSQYVKAWDGLVEIIGTPSGPRLERAWGSWVSEGEGVLILFKYDAGAWSSIDLGSGEWGTPGWREWDIGSDFRDTWFTQGTSPDVHEGPLTGNLTSNPDTWYYLLLAVGQEGEIVAKVWERDDPSQEAEYRRTFGEDWAGRDWGFWISAYGGNVYLDSFTQIAFSDIATAQAESIATDQPEVASAATAQAGLTVTARYAPIATVLAEGTATAQVVDATAQAAATATIQDILTSLANTPLSNPEVLYHDDFDRLSSSEWDYDSQYVEASDGLVEITSAPHWPRLERAWGSWLNEGEGVLILFKYDTDAGSVFNLGSGEWETPGGREWDVGIGNSSLDTWFKQGTSPNVHEGPITGNLTPNPHTWYYILLAVGEEGEIVAKVWERDDPSQEAEYRRTFGEDWAGRDWRLWLEASNGKMYVDSVTQIAFSELR